MGVAPEDLYHVLRPRFQREEGVAVDTVEYLPPFLNDLPFAEGIDFIFVFFECRHIRVYCLLAKCHTSFLLGFILNYTYPLSGSVRENLSIVSFLWLLGVGYL